MDRARSVPAAALLAAAAALLPGCYFARHAIPTDASGMDFPRRHFSYALQDQARRSGALVSGLPDVLARHLRECRRNLVEDPAAIR
jgi:hypothetical protein